MGKKKNKKKRMVYPQGIYERAVPRMCVCIYSYPVSISGFNYIFLVRNTLNNKYPPSYSYLYSSQITPNASFPPVFTRTTQTTKERKPASRSSIPLTPSSCIIRILRRRATLATPIPVLFVSPIPTRNLQGFPRQRRPSMWPRSHDQLFPREYRRISSLLEPTNSITSTNYLEKNHNE